MTSRKDQAVTAAMLTDPLTPLLGIAPLSIACSTQKALGDMKKLFPCTEKIPKNLMLLHSIKRPKRWAYTEIKRKDIR